MKEGWEYIDFKDVYPVKMGKTPPRGDKSSWDEKKETNNKWVSIADISNNEGKIIEDTKEYISDTAATKINKVAKGSLLMSFKLSIGRMAFAGDDLYTNEAIIAIPESDRYILRFMYYYLLSYDWLSLTEGNEKVKGATLNKTSIGKIQLPVLSLIEQQSIVDYLDSAFAKIDAMKANVEKALNEAKALFQAKLTEFMKPKEGVKLSRIGDIALRITKGASPKWQGINYVGNEGVLFITSENVRDGFIELNPPKYVDERFNQKQQRSILMKNDVLVNIVGASIGRAAIYDLDVTNANINQAVALVRIDSNVLLAKYLCMFLNSSIAFEKYNLMKKDAARANLSLENIGDVELYVPSIEKQHIIATTLDSLKSKVNRLQENYNKISQECDALKQAILRQVFE